MMAATCHGCDATLLPSRGNRPRKWCSDRCRKAQYDLECVSCGGRVDGTTPGKMPDPSAPVCKACATDFYRLWDKPTILAAIRKWADEHGGIPPSANDWQRARATGDKRYAPVNSVVRYCGSWNAAIQEAGFEPHATGPVGGYLPLTASQRKGCALRYSRGESSVRIAADYGCSPAAVLKWARHAGVPIRAAWGQRAERVAA